MAYQVVVAFGDNKIHEINLLDGDLIGLVRDQATHWMDEEWVRLECETSNPVGKTLVLDKILGIARSAGERRFAEDPEWARQYARCVVLLLDRLVVRVDVAEMRVG